MTDTIMTLCDRIDGLLDVLRNAVHDMSELDLETNRFLQRA